jgi:nicotinate-nucleotide--dimethylbenzimidazole phosphoribosyltransferase
VTGVPSLRGIRVRPPAEVAADLEAAIAAIGPLDAVAGARAEVHLDRLTKPPGSLGRLEELVVALAGITGRWDAPVDPAVIVIAAADHGVAARGVSAYPSAVTAQMVANFAAGGAAVNALAATVGAGVVVVDVGVAGPAMAPAEGSRATLVEARVRSGTGDLLAGPAMSSDETRQAIGVGLDVARGLVSGGARVIGLGEMGIGNTTVASALVAASTGASVEAVTGTGTGLDAAGRARKLAVIEDVLARHAPDPADPLRMLAAIGGLEIACLVGVLLGAAAARIPVVLDGFITGAAALVGAGLAPGLPPRLIAAHRSVEPGHAVVLDHLGLRPLLDLDLRLGEGTGAALALGLLRAAVAARDGMATFADAGVSDRDASTDD